MKDYYYILGIEKNASADEVKKAYRKLSVKFHPDKNKGDKFFENRFKEIQEAYEILSDKNKRILYDSKYGKERPNTGGSYSNRKDNVQGEIISFEASKKYLTNDEEITLFWATKNVKYTTLSCFKGNLQASGKKTIRIHASRSKIIPVKLTAVANNGLQLTKTLNIDYTKKSNDKTYEDAVNNEENKTKDSNSRGSRKFPFFWILVLTTLVFVLLVVNKNKLDSSALKENNVITDNPQTFQNDGKSNTPVANISLTSNQALLKFIDNLNNKRYKEAYDLTKNDLWRDLEFFKTTAWGNLSNFKVVNYPKEKKYHSKWDADHILNLELSAYDSKEGGRKEMSFDFHLKKIYGQWKIVRMIYPKENEMWYFDDPLYENKDDPKMKVFNRPHVLLQAYYDNFASKNDVKKNRYFYEDTLIIHFDDKMLDAENAIKKDFEDFSRNEISSYQILVNSYGMITNKYEYFDIVNVPLKYYVTKNNGNRSKFEVNIFAVLNKSNDKIIAIGNSIKVEDLINAILRYRGSEANNNQEVKDEDFEIFNPVEDLVHGKSPYSYCFGSNNECDYSCSQISVKASYNSDVIVLIKRNGKVYRNAFISKGRTFVFNLPNGTYQPFFYYGNTWSNRKYMKETSCGSLYGGFTANEHFGKDLPQYLNNNLLTYELVLQQNGNFSTKASSKNEAF